MTKEHDDPVTKEHENQRGRNVVKRLEVQDSERGAKRRSAEYVAGGDGTREST